VPRGARGGKNAARDHVEKRGEIVEAAAEIFYKRGFSAGTTRDVSNMLGLTQPAIYHYVGSKHDLLSAIASRIDTEIQGSLRRGLAKGDTPQAKLVGIIEEITAAVISNQHAVAVYYKEQNHLPADLRTQIVDHEREFVHATAELVRQLQEESILPQGESPTVLAQAILGMASWLYHWYRPYGSADAPTIAHTFIRLLKLDNGGIAENSAQQR
jgi:AcrR family transcriptional regulator